MTEYNKTESENENLKPEARIQDIQNEQPKSENKKEFEFKEFNWVMGLLLGIAFWMAFDNIGIGIALGVVFAIVFKDDKK